MKKKICIIIDNPFRDLKGMLLLSLYLVEKFDIYLVEQYNKREIYLLDPSIVIFHNARENNISYINFCKQNDIKTCVLDTEGGYDSFGVMNEIINKELKKNIKIVDLYFCWGLYMYRKLRKKIEKKDQKKIKLTGSPKADLLFYYSEKRFAKETDILFNTSFPIIDPRYGNRNITIKSFKEDLNYINNKKKNKYLKGSQSNQNEFIELIKKISIDFKKQKISIRVHPFESKKKYEILSKQFKNIKIVSDEEDLNETLKKTKVLIHYNCTTSFEFYLLKQYKTFMPFYFKSSKYLKFNNYIKKSSELNSSYQELKKNLEINLNLKDKKNFFSKSFVKKNLDQIFFNLNGKASKSILKHINSLELKPTKNIKKFKNNFFYNNSLKEKFINFFYYFDPIIYRFIRNLIYPWKLRNKELDLNQIKHEMNKLMKLTNIRKKVIIRRARTKYYNITKVRNTFAFEIKK